MRSITLFLEGRERTNFDSVSLLSSEIAAYKKKMEKQMSEEAKQALLMMDKYGILNKIDAEAIRTSTKSKFKSLAKQFNCEPTDIEALHNILKNLGKNIRMLPMYQTETERKELEAGKLAMDDITMDLETEQGKNAVAKQYAPLVMKMASQYVGKSALSKDELISAGMWGLAYAIDTFQKPTEKIEDTFTNTDEKEIKDGKEKKTQTFKQWAGWCIRNKILDDINNLSRTVKVDAYHQAQLLKQGKEIPTSKSIETFGKDDEENGGMIDRMIQLANDPESAGELGEEQKWAVLFQNLEKKFPKRDVTIFAKMFGMNGEQKMQGKEIAQEFGISTPLVTSIKNKIINYIQSNKNLCDMLATMLESYTYNIITKVWNKPQSVILEALRSDDTYIMLEELNRWRNPKALENAINMVLYENGPFTKEDTIFITDCLLADNENYIIQNYKDNRKTIIRFLESMYPQDVFARKTDAFICEKLEELRKLVNEYQIEL